MKQFDRFPRDGINAGEVRPLVAIAGKAGQGQIARRIGPAVNDGDDMVHFKRERVVLLRQPTVFAGGFRTPLDELDEVSIHEGLRKRGGGV